MSNRTRRLVLETAERLNYRPNSAARALTTGKTANVGIVVPDTANPFFPSLIKGIQARAPESGRLVFLADTDEDPRTEAHLVEQVAGRVDGVILCSPGMGTRELLDFATKVPIAMVNRQLEGVASVLFDDASGICQSISHLSALGHRRITWLGRPEKSFCHAQRSRAMYDCAGRAGVDLVGLGNFSPHFGSGIAGADLVLASGASAVVAYNHPLALGVLNRLSSRGIEVSGGLSVVGNDDIAFASMVSPALATVSLPGASAGRAALDLLSGLLEDPAKRKELPTMISTHLLVRGSTGVAATGPAATDPAAIGVAARRVARPR